jgi:hypothetical protein
VNRHRMQSLLRHTTVALLLALLASAVGAGIAQGASPAWKLIGGEGPTNLPTRQSEIQRVTVEAEGGSFSFLHNDGETTGTPVVVEAHLSYTSGKPVATIESVAGGTALEAGDRVTGPGLPPYPAETIITSCSSDCNAVGSTVTLSNSPESSETGAVVEVFTKELTGVTASLAVGDEVAGASFEYFAPGTEVTAVGAGTIKLSNATTHEYLTSEGAIGFDFSEKSAPIESDASPRVLASALEAMPALGPGSVSVSGGPGGDAAHPYFVDFTGSLADRDVQQLAIDGSTLSGAHAHEEVFTVLPGGPGTGEIVIDPSNVGGEETSGVITATLGPLPPGVVISGPAEGEGAWSCPEAAGESSITCTSSEPVPALGAAFGIRVPVEVTSAAPFNASVTIGVEGAGGGSATYQVPIVVANTPAPFGIQAFWGGNFDSEGHSVTQAGAHPYSAQTYFLLNTVRGTAGRIVSVADSRDVLVNLPPGFAGDPLVTPRCPQALIAAFEYEACNKEMSLGNFIPSLNEFGVRGFDTRIFNDVPAQGSAAQFTTEVGGPLQSLIGSVNSSGDYGVKINAPVNPTFERIFGGYVALEGFPPSAKGKAFMTNPTDCEEEAREAPKLSVSADSWEEIGKFTPTAVQVLPAVTGCDKLEFTPTFSFQPTVTQGTSGTGATATLQIPQDGLTDPAKLAQPNLKKAVVTLPQGLSLNPSSANGLEACSEAQIGYVGPGEMPNPTRFNEAPPSCPEASKLGTFEVKTPLLEAPVDGTIYLAAQEENPFHSLIGLYLVVNDPRTGIVLKLPGQVTPDPTSGQLTATFDDNPQLPFETLTLHFRGGGARSELATPEVCGHYETTGSLTPWSAPESGPAAQIKEAGFTVSEGCAPSAATRPFSPSFEAGTTSPVAGSYSPLVIKVNRNDGEQELTKLDFTLPEGLVADLASVPYCSDAGIDAARTKTGRAEQASPSCPSASQLGTVDTAAGVGSEPVHVGGHVYLAGPYEGAPLSAVVITPAVAGPFDLGDVVVRAPLFIDPATTRVTAKSDPVPTILKGIQLKLRSVTITLDHPGFTLNPTSCDAMSVTASLSSSDGATASPANHFQVGGCSGLQFKPSLTASTKGKASKVNGASLTVKIAAKPGEANIHKVNLQLPVTLPSRLSTLQKACTEAVFNANPASCPADSVIGSGTAHTPILQAPLTGPAYLVSHGGAAFPDVEFVLQAAERGGDIEVILDGNTQIKKGITYSNFETVPDAPISTFESTFPQGPHSILGAFVPASANYSLCGQTLRIPTTLTAQNGAVIKQSTAIAITGCAPAIMVRSHRVSGRTATLVLQVPSAGKLIASGTGLTTAKKSVTKATSVTLKVSLTSKERTFLARHPHRKVKLRVKLRFTPKKGAPLSNAVTVLIG